MAFTKNNNYFYDSGASIDANYGPWDSIDAYLAWLRTNVGLNAPYIGTTIAVHSGSSINKYVYNGSNFVSERADSDNAINSSAASAESAESAKTSAMNAEKSAASARADAASAKISAESAAADSANAVSALNSIMGHIEDLDTSASSTEQIQALNAKIALQDTKFGNMAKYLSCAEYKRTPNGALQPDGTVSNTDAYRSIVIDVNKGDYVEFPSSSSVDASQVEVQYSDGTRKDCTITSIDSNTAYVIAPAACTLWISYYQCTDTFVGKHVAVLPSKAYELFKRASSSGVDTTSGEYSLSEIIKNGMAFFRDSCAIGANASYCMFSLPISKNQKITIPGGSVIGAQSADVCFVKDGVVTHLGESTGESVSHTVKKEGTIYVNYYFPGGTAEASCNVPTTAKIVIEDNIGGSASGGLASAGRKVLWIGTSIPWGGGSHSDSYVFMVQDMLGIKTLYNKCVPSSGIVVNTGTMNNDRDCKDLCETTEEKHARYDILVGTNDYITEQRISAYSYDKLVLPYINGEIDSCDTIIIDHGYNDRAQIAADLKNNVSINSTDRSTYIGAFNYLLDKIYNVNKRIQVIVVGYFCKENTMFKYSEKIDGVEVGCHGEYIDTMLKKLSAHYSFTYLPTYEASCINKLNWSTMLPDGVHPHSDTTQAANKYIARYLANRLSGIL